MPITPLILRQNMNHSTQCVVGLARLCIPWHSFDHTKISGIETRKRREEPGERVQRGGGGTRHPPTAGRRGFHPG